VPQRRGAKPLSCHFVKRAIQSLGHQSPSRNGRVLLEHRSARRATGAWLMIIASAVLLTACASGPSSTAPPHDRSAEARALIDRLLPRPLSDRAGWAADLYSGFAEQAIEPSRENICAVVAVIEQESGFRVDPVVPDLGAIAWREIDSRAERAHVPVLLVHGALQLNSSSGRSYSERIDAARTEKELSDVFEDFIDAVPLGRKLFEGWNPIRTRGPMQVNIAFAAQYAAVRPYPYPVKVSIADEVFTRRGSLYFGIAHLFAYSPPYDRYLYRFADFNAGQYASRNAAFQSALSSITAIPLARDGALLPNDNTVKGAGDTELAARTLEARLDISERSIHSALEQGKSKEFEKTPLYQGVFAMAERSQGRPMPRALVPCIDLHGPKIHRTLTTEWYAHRVDERFKRCLAR
jgi:uncharacterized protein DUF1615